VAWNSAGLLGRALQRLRSSAARAGAAVETIVVDNDSADATAAIARAAGADRVVRNPLNAGYAVAAAQGMALARAPWVLLLNPDVTVDEAFVGAVLAAARRAPADVATIVPELRFEQDRSRIASRGLSVDAAGIPAEIGTGLSLSEPVDASAVFGGSGAACALRMSAVRAVGGLEPAYFAYMEDVDLAWRLRRAGYRAALVPGATGFHVGSASTGEGSPLKLYLVARNRRLLFRLHGPWAIGARSARAVTEAGHCLVAALTSGRLAPAVGRLAALRQLSYVHFLRRAARLHPPAPPVEPPLAPRVPLAEALRRKRRARPLMGPSVPPPSRRSRAR
jgi:GT2 family glycosyltransferase